MDLLEDLKMLLLNFNFVMIYIIHEMSVLLNSNLNCNKDSIFKCFLRSIIDFYFFFKSHNIYRCAIFQGRGGFAEFNKLFVVKNTRKKDREKFWSFFS